MSERSGCINRPDSDLLRALDSRAELDRLISAALRTLDDTAESRPSSRAPPSASLQQNRRSIGGAAVAPLHFPGPPSSTARLARSCTQPSRELCYSTPLPPPFCEPVRLFCGCEPEELPKDPAEELPEELRMVESQKQEEKAEKTKKADAGAAVARACGVDNK